MKFRQLIRKHLTLSALLAVVAGYILFRLLPENSDVQQIMLRVFMAVLMLAFMYLAGGSRMFEWPERSGRTVFRKSLSLIVAVVIVSGITLLPRLGTPPDPNWPQILISVFILCMAVGIFEEGMFRGVLLNGLLARMGGTRAGMTAAWLISSFTFGFAHVMSFLLYPEMNGLIAGQMFMKTLITGSMGLLVAAIYMQTRNFWGIVVIHALNDFLPYAVMKPFGVTDLGSYVSVDAAEGIRTIGSSLFVLIIYSGVIITAVRTFRGLNVPHRGYFTPEK